MCGYDLMTKGYRIWIISEKKNFETNNVTLDGNKKGLMP